MHHKFDSCRDHRIYFIIHSKDGTVLFLDSIVHKPSRYAKFMTILAKFELKKVDHITQGALYNIVEDLCSFILNEVIPYEGKYRDTTSVKAKV